MPADGIKVVKLDAAPTHDLVSPRYGGLGHRRRLWHRCHIPESGFNFAPVRGPTDHSARAYYAVGIDKTTRSRKRACD